MCEVVQRTCLGFSSSPTIVRTLNREAAVSPAAAGGSADRIRSDSSVPVKHVMDNLAVILSLFSHSFIQALVKSVDLIWVENQGRRK